MNKRDINDRLPPLGLVALFLVFGSVIALIPFTVTAELIRVRRMRRRARSFHCPRCQRLIGTEALKLRAKFRDQILDNAVLTKRLKRAHALDAVCPACEMLFSFDKKTRDFSVLDLGAPDIA